MGRKMLLYALTAACILLKPSQGSPKDKWPLNGHQEELLYNTMKEKVTKKFVFVDGESCPLVSSLSAFGSGSSSFYYNGAGRSVADLEVRRG
ncbi:hypothetical protein V1264_000097 [Littorina saxatilis]|uniref:Uncharacterized protein n=1 Tax=Littorina saxatilis TaxID=31220 RepID=A0AAN9BWF9_9CAEN